MHGKFNLLARSLGSSVRLGAAAILLSMISFSARADQVCQWIDNLAGYVVLYCYDVSIPTPPASAHNIFRYYSAPLGDRLFTTQLNEVYGGTAGYYYEMVAFAVYNSPIDANMVSLDRCWVTNIGNHFATTNPNCEGQTSDGSLGYVSTTHRAGTTELYRFWNGYKDHLVTTSYAEGANAGFGYYGVLGYVPN
jgi:hypothetical protein